MSTNNSSIDQLLDLLIDALEERKVVRSAETTDAEVAELDSAESAIHEPLEALSPQIVPEVEAEPSGDDFITEWRKKKSDEQPTQLIDEPEVEMEAEPAISISEDEVALDSAETHPPTPLITEPVLQESVNLNKMLGRLAIVLAIIIALINIPLGEGAFGSTLATIMPEVDSTVSIAGWDGMLLQASGLEVYILEDGHRRWITSRQLFLDSGYRWSDIHQVTNEQLAEFPLGTPIVSIAQLSSEPVVAKCGSPHIYVVDGSEKHWIRDIETFSAEGYLWSDIVFMSCTTLRNIPDGETIPPGSGEPPGP